MDKETISSRAIHALFSPIQHTINQSGTIKKSHDMACFLVGWIFCGTKTGISKEVHCQLNVVNIPSDCKSFKDIKTGGLEPSGTDRPLLDRIGGLPLHS